MLSHSNMWTFFKIRTTLTYPDFQHYTQMASLLIEAYQNQNRILISISKLKNNLK